MPELLEGVIDEFGQITLVQTVHTGCRRRVLVIVLDDASPGAADRSVAPSDTVFTDQRYILDKQLGSGGMGETFLGKDSLTNQSVCIKRLRPHFRRATIIQEWQSLSRIQCPNVVRYFDHFDRGGQFHLVMEYIDGPTLAQKMQSQLSVPECLWLGLNLMWGLKAFHALDVIHCDLKPENILIHPTTMLDEPGQAWVPVIIDFGLAVLDQHDDEGVLTAEGRVAGTPMYMAPEQVQGWMLTTACDIYAVGLILWEAICGRRPFNGDVYGAMAAKVRQTDGLRLESPPKNLPAAVTELVTRCTHPNPSHRPSADEAAKILESYCR